MKLLIKTKALGYTQSETLVEVVHDFTIVANDFCVEILGSRLVVPIFKKFELEGLDVLAEDSIRDYGMSLEDARALTVRHLQRIVSDYLMKGDTLTAGAGLLGAHQYVYIPETTNEAFLEMRRCEAFLKSKIKEVV